MYRLLLQGEITNWSLRSGSERREMLPLTSEAQNLTNVYIFLFIRKGKAEGYDFQVSILFSISVLLQSVVY